MDLEKLMKKKRTAIADAWFDLVVRTYPSDTQQFLKSQKDPFANPVGQITRKGLQALFDHVLGEIDPETVKSDLDPIIRIRAIQNFSSSEAVAFIFDLKAIVRKVVGNETVSDQPFAEWLAFEHNVDALALAAFDVYMTCREKIYALKADNERTQVYRAFSRAGLLTGDFESEAKPGDP